MLCYYWNAISNTKYYKQHIHRFSAVVLWRDNDSHSLSLYYYFFSFLSYISVCTFFLCCVVLQLAAYGDAYMYRVVYTPHFAKKYNYKCNSLSFLLFWYSGYECIGWNRINMCVCVLILAEGYWSMDGEIYFLFYFHSFVQSMVNIQCIYIVCWMRKSMEKSYFSKLIRASYKQSLNWAFHLYIFLPTFMRNLIYSYFQLCIYL